MLKRLEKKMNEQSATQQDLERLVSWAKAQSHEYENIQKADPAYVYFITDGEYVKIGVTSNLEKRLESLQTGNPKKLTVLYAFYTEWPYTVESKLHKKYADKHVFQEWYDIIDDFPILKRNYLTLKDMELILNMSHSSVYNLINEPNFPTIRIGKCIRIKPSDLNDYLYTHDVRYNKKRILLNEMPLSFVDE